MSKKNDDTILPEPEKIIPVEINTVNTLLPENYPALESLSWFMSDINNVNNWAGVIFRGGFDKTEPRLNTLKEAATKALDETEDDIKKLREFLTEYVTLNS